MTNDPSKLKTIFMGTPEFAGEILSALIHEKYNLVAVYTQPDKKVGRKQILEKSPVKIIAEKNNIPVFTPNRLNQEALAKMEKQKPDLILVAAYGKILPKTVLDLPEFGAINVHASLLPKYRGASPIQNAILNGETETGSTIMLMDEGVDTGAILSQRVIGIDKNETSSELSEKLAGLSSDLLLETLPLWLAKKITPQKQVDSKASLCRMIKREDGKIDWNDSAKNIYNRFRAFYPWPGVFSNWERNGKTLRLKLNKINLSGESQEKKSDPGTVLNLGEEIAVATSSSFVILEAIQLEGKPETKIENFINGYPDFIGSGLK
ncbi:MAG: methionyl-tRNA formyltransferase [Parcubacteria group bacterium]